MDRTLFTLINMPKSNANCCVVGCFNTYAKTTGLKLYSFPSKPWDRKRRLKWIASVNRKNSDGTSWEPSKYSAICNYHFVNKEFVNHPKSPSYIPTIFPISKRKSSVIAQKQKLQNEAIDNEVLEVTGQKNNISLGCQESVSAKPGKVIYKIVRRQTTSASTQTDLTIDTSRVVASITFENGRQNVKQQQDKLIRNIDPGECRGFHGRSSIHDDTEMVNISGVTLAVFSYLLRYITAIRNSRMPCQDKLLLFLMKMKHGFNYSVLSVLFGIHRTQASRIFKLVLTQLVIVTSAPNTSYIPWLSPETIRSQLPKEFQIKHPNCRCVLYFFHVCIQKPDSEDKRSCCYSASKNAYTLKFLLCVAPHGVITYKSKAYGGGTSDGAILLESGLLDLLQPGDVIITDKVFPAVMHPVMQYISVITLPPVEQREGNISGLKDGLKHNGGDSIRVHIERAIERLKNFHILKFVAHDLYNNIGDIMHMACVIVNLDRPQPTKLPDQPPQEVGQSNTFNSTAVVIAPVTLSVPVFPINEPPSTDPIGLQHTNLHTTLPKMFPMSVQPHAFSAEHAQPVPNVSSDIPTDSLVTSNPLPASICTMPAPIMTAPSVTTAFSDPLTTCVPVTFGTPGSLFSTLNSVPSTGCTINVPMAVQANSLPMTTATSSLM